MILVISALIITYFVFYTNVHPEQIVDERDPSYVNLDDFENVNFTSTVDEKILKGWFIPADRKSREDPRPTIIVMHGYGLSKSHSLDWSYYLAEDYNLFLFDFRGHGASEGTVTTFGNKETRDLLGAIEYLKTRDDIDTTRYGLLGYSLGASTAVISAQITADIKAVVADSPYAYLTDEMDRLYEDYWIFQKPLSWLTGLWARVLIRTNPSDVTPAESIKYTTAPMLLMGAEDDSEDAGNSAQRIYDNALSENSALWTVPGNHMSLFGTHREEYKQKVQDFFDANL